MVLDSWPPLRKRFVGWCMSFVLRLPAIFGAARRKDVYNGGKYISDRCLSKCDIYRASGTIVVVEN